MRCTLASIAAASAVILIGFAMWPGDPAGNVVPNVVAQQPAPDDDSFFDPPAFSPSAVASPDKKDKRQAAVEAKLATEIEQLNFVEVPLNKALETIGEQVKVDILINETALNEEGVRVDVPVSLELKHTKVSAATAIQLILERATEPGFLGYKIRDGFVYIQTALASDEDLEIEVYDVRDLLEGVQPISRVVCLQQTSCQPNYGGVGGGFFRVEDNIQRRENDLGKVPALSAELAPPGAAQPKPAPERQRSGEPAKPAQPEPQFPSCYHPSGYVPAGPCTITISPGNALIEVITTTAVGPWKEVNGAGGTIEEFDGTLVVRQTQKSHQEIKRLLEMLRATKKGQDGAK